MKKSYYFGKKSNKLLTLAMVMAFSLMSVFTFAQTTIVWNGSVDTDASNPLNWTPNLSVIGNVLQVDSAHKYTNKPILSLTGDNAISQILVAADAVFTIANAGNFLDINNGSSNYIAGTIVVQAGNVSFRKNLYLDKTSSTLNIEGGSVETRDNFLIGPSDLSIGGQVNISGTGRLYSRKAPGRISNDSLMSVITIIEDGYLEVGVNWVTDANYRIGRNQIISDDSFDPYSYYDVGLAHTFVDLRSKDELFLINSGTVQGLVDVVIPVIEAVENRGFTTLVSKEWKYATVSGGPYVSFAPARTGDVLDNLSFANAGTYFIVLEGETGTATIISDEVQVSITSPMVSLDPDGEQTIRVGWTGGMITATTLEVATSLEWKYATASGGPYLSFNPAVTVNEYIPDFIVEGNYFVICEALVNAVTYASPEVSIKMVARNAASQSIVWTGAFSTDASDNRNYEPMMHPWFNTINVASSFVDTPPVLATTGNDTIQYIALGDSAEFIVSKAATDTLYISGDGYQFGKIIVESGALKVNKYMRLDGNNSGVILKNSSKYIGTADGLIIGQSGGPNGGIFNIQDNAYAFILGDIWRWATDTTHSILTISENGMLELGGDRTGDVATWIITKNQLRALDGFVIKYVYSADRDVTTITAKSEVAFDITPLTDQFVGVGGSTNALSTINTETITSQEWKYATESGGTLTSFDPAETGATLTASFNAAGSYFIVCVGSDGTDEYVSSEVKVNVVTVAVTPAEAQSILEFEEGTLLTVAESMVANSREWKFSTTSGSGYASFAVAQLANTYKPFFTTAGTYYVVCVSVYSGMGIISNEVEVVVSLDNTVFNESLMPLEVYPNPSSGKFYLNIENAYTLKVFDITGKSVLSQEFRGGIGPQEITLSTKGIHILKVIQGDNVKIAKIVVN